jgi:hypothetical protein
MSGVNNPVTGSNFNVGSDPDILVKQTGLDEDNPDGNRIIFVGKEGDVSKLSIFIPEDGDPVGGGTQINGAVTELGFEYGQGETKVGKATEFFLEDVRFGGNFGLFTNDLSATASLGFLGIKANAVGTLDPLATGTAAGGTSRTIILATGTPGGNDEYNGDYIRVQTGDAVDILEIKDYVASSRTVTIDGSWSATIEGSTTYKIVKGERFLEASVDSGIPRRFGSCHHQPIDRRHQ